MNFSINTLMYDMWDQVGAFVANLLSFIPKIAYMLANSFLAVCDLFQYWVRKLAGLDVYYIDGEAQTGDIVYQFIRGIFLGEYPALHNVFIGLIILAAILLILSTIISIIRNEYTAEKGENSKGKIISQSLKSIVYVAIVPIICMLGVYLANVVLVAVDRATTTTSATSTILNTSLLEPYTITYNASGNPDANSGTETTAPDSVQSYISYNLFGFSAVGTTGQTFSGMIFKTSAYGANRVRATENQSITSNNQENINGFFQLLQEGRATNFGGLFTDDNNDPDMVALYIDTAFADNVKLKEKYQLSYEESYIRDYGGANWGNSFGIREGWEYQTMNRFDVELVWYYYDLWKFDFVVCFGAVIIMLNIFINIIFGLMKRLIELVGLFLISAPLIALMPLDNGGAYNKWRGKFLKNTLMAYGAIGGMNLVFLIMPYLAEISFFNNDFLDGLVSTLFVIVALIMVKDFIAMVSDFVGGGDANKDGEAIDGEVGKLAAKAGAMALGAGALAAGTGLLTAKGLKFAGGKAVKQMTAGSKFKAAKQKHGEEMTKKYAEAEQEKNDALKDISDREAEFRKQAEDSLSSTDIGHLKLQAAHEAKMKNHGLPASAAAEDREFKRLKQEKIKTMAQEAMKAQQDQVMADYKAKTDAIGEEDRKMEPKLSDFQVHGLSATSGALKSIVDGDHRKKYKASMGKALGGIMPATGRIIKETSKTSIKALTGDNFASGVKDGVGGDGLIATLGATLFKGLSDNKKDKKAIKEQKELLKRQQAAAKELGQDKTTEEKILETLEAIKKQGER